MTKLSELDARYGRSPAGARRRRWFAIGTAGTSFVALAAWLIWAGFGSLSAQFQVLDTGFVIADDRAVEVRWTLTVEPGTPMQCAVQALNPSFGIVGWKVVDVAASEQRTREFSETVLTTELATTGLIYRCWLT